MAPERSLVDLAADELDALARLLADAGLPHEDIGEPGRRFYRLDEAGRTVGWGGLELTGADALLRSLVVPAARRGGGIGRDLVARIAAAAHGQGVERLWLLTTTAAPFFAKIGFEETARDAAPAPIRATREFRDICPASATCMVRRIRDGA
jgi:amino-acid N-acetyltransferase